MSLNARLQPWSGSGFRHLPATVPESGVLDFTYLGRARDNRWSDYGERTLYLAGDIGVVISEWGRHLDSARTLALAKQTQERIVYRLDVVLDRLLDIRDPVVWADLHLANAPMRFLDSAIARATARFIRTTTTAQGLFVPSVAMLDKLGRGNLVLFIEKLPADITHVISHIQVEGPLSVSSGYSPA